MSVRLRNPVLPDVAVAPPQSAGGWRGWVGLPPREDDADSEMSIRLDQTFTGTLVAGFSGLLALAALAFILRDALAANDFAAQLVIAVAALGFASDGLVATRCVRQKLKRWRSARGLLFTALIGSIASASWAAAGALFSQFDQSILPAIIATTPLLLGLVAASSLPSICFLRGLVAVIAILAVRGPSDGLAAIGAGAVLISVSATMQFARREQAMRGVMSEQNTIRRSRDMLHAFESSGRGWFWQTNSRGRLTYISEGAAEQFGEAADALLGQHFANLLGVTTTRDFDESQTQQSVEFTLGAGVPFSNIVVRAPGEAECWWSLTGVPIEDAHGRCLGFNGSAADLTHQEKRAEDANRLAHYDGLTGLPNRVAMRGILDEMLQDDGLRTPHCGLFLLDLDRFKNVNDTLGHPMGDALLKVVAQRLARVVGNRGKVGRLGGDEFKVIVPDVSDRAALAELADAIIARLSLPYVIDDCSIQIGATIGIAMAPSDGNCPDELTRNADLALYSAKAAGKGVHRFYSPDMHSDANDRRSIENDLRDVLAKGELSVVYQPIVDAESERVVSFEALMRWDHPERGAIPPSIFIPIAEEINLINRLGDWAIRTACAAAMQWPDHVNVSVNLSPLQFASPGLMNTLVGALADSGLAPGRLELEVTEGVLLNDDPAIDKALAAVTAMGIRLVLDDFGTGYASLAYLKRVPFSKVKIDRSFVRSDSDNLQRNHAIIRAIVGLANSLDMETVAEGVETLDEIELIRQLGCSQIQGYIFGYPMCASDAAMLASLEPVLDDTGQLIDREPRLALLRIARMHTAGLSHQVKIRNISANGAMVEAPGNVPIAFDAELVLADGWKFGGIVRWRRGNRFGLEFAEPIALNDFVMGQPAPVAAADMPPDVESGQTDVAEPIDIPASEPMTVTANQADSDEGQVALEVEEPGDDATIEESGDSGALGVADPATEAEPVAQDDSAEPTQATDQPVRPARHPIRRVA